MKIEPKKVIFRHRCQKCGRLKRVGTPMRVYGGIDENTGHFVHKYYCIANCKKPKAEGYRVDKSEAALIPEGWVF